jgi:calcineurin-like phosphoesterase
MRVLFIGDIVGSPGRQIVRERLADIVAQRQIDLVIANGENSASGFGITPRLAEELLAMGIDVLTGGNHSWDRKEILEFMPHEPRLLRPANFPEGNVGSGLYVGTAKNGVKYAVLNLQGRVFMTPRRAGHCDRGDAHARNDCRRARPTRWHGVYHGRGHERATRRGDRDGPSRYH